MVWVIYIGQKLSIKSLVEEKLKLVDAEYDQKLEETESLEITSNEEHLLSIRFRRDMGQQEYQRLEKQHEALALTLERERMAIFDTPPEFLNELLTQEIDQKIEEVVSKHTTSLKYAHTDFGQCLEEVLRSHFQELIFIWDQYHQAQSHQALIQKIQNLPHDEGQPAQYCIIPSEFIPFFQSYWRDMVFVEKGSKTPPRPFALEWQANIMFKGAESCIFYLKESGIQKFLKEQGRNEFSFESLESRIIEKKEDIHQEVLHLWKQKYNVLQDIKQQKLESLQNQIRDVSIRLQEVNNTIQTLCQEEEQEKTRMNQELVRMQALKDKTIQNIIDEREKERICIKQTYDGLYILGRPFQELQQWRSSHAPVFFDIGNSELFTIAAKKEVVVFKLMEKSFFIKDYCQKRIT